MVFADDAYQIGSHHTHPKTVEHHHVVNAKEITMRSFAQHQVEVFRYMLLDL